MQSDTAVTDTPPLLPPLRGGTRRPSKPAALLDRKGIHTDRQLTANYKMAILWTTLRTPANLTAPISG